MQLRALHDLELDRNRRMRQLYVIKVCVT